MKNEIVVKCTNLTVKISFGFILILTLMFILDKGHNALMSVTAIMLHELSHIAALLLLGGRIRAVSLSLCHVDINAYKDELSRGSRLLIALSGPGINLIIGFALFNYLKDFALVNLAIGFFQLLPITSLDGDSALEALFVPCKMRKIISLVFCFFTALLGFTVLLNSEYNFSVLIISMYLIFLTLKLQ